LRRRFQLGLLGGCVIFGALTFTVHPLAVAWFTLTFVIHLGFLASMGLWVSSVSSTPLWATFTTAVLLLIIFGGPWWFLTVLAPDPYSWWKPMLETGINPLGGWWFLLFSWQEAEKADIYSHRHLIAVLLGLVICATLTAAFWLIARRKLDVE
jgi:hypothetical protein